MEHFYVHTWQCTYIMPTLATNGKWLSGSDVVCGVCGAGRWLKIGPCLPAGGMDGSIFGAVAAQPRYSRQPLGKEEWLALLHADKEHLAAALNIKPKMQASGILLDIAHAAPRNMGSLENGVSASGCPP
jgi:hypothetical protein